AFFLSCAATALVLYEYIITIELEVQQIWRRKISGASILFILTRYLTLLNRVFVVIGLGLTRVLACSCRTITWLQAVTTSILVVVMSAIAGIRVYALWNRDIRLFALVILCGVFPAIANLFIRSASLVYIVPTNLYSCQAAPTAMSAVAYVGVSIATRAAAILADGLVVVLTWIKTYRVYVLTRKFEFRNNYAMLILRDGGYILVALAVWVLNLVAIIYIMNVGANVLNDMIVTLSSILMARFLLNLRVQRDRVESGPYSTDLSSAGSLSTLNFIPDLASSMGVSVGVDEDEEEDEDDDTDTCKRNFVVVAKSCQNDVWLPPTNTDCQGKIIKGVWVLGEKEAVWV
ncbi:hypothetical protein C8Q80DRAFT_1094190, partial [Daedaleopsis nitida]